MDKLKKLLEDVVVSGRDIGMQLAVYHKGELVTNVWTGTADTETREPVTEHTLFPAFSTGKGITATMLHILAERNVLDYEQPICEIWPEFAAHGKQNVLIKHALNHTAGIPQMPENLTTADLNDWQGMCSRIARLEPLWPPGTYVEYHALTYGWIIGRIIELASGMSFADFLRHEICNPLGIRDMYVGIPKEEWELASIATLYEPGFDPSKINQSGIKVIPDCCLPMCGWLNQAGVLQSCIPGGNGMMSAHALARHYAALLPDGIDGVKLLSDDHVKQVIRVSSREEKPMVNNVFGLGYALGKEGDVFGPSKFGHGGYGGSIGFADTKRNIAIGLTKNYFHDKSAEMEIIAAVLDYVTG